MAALFRFIQLFFVLSLSTGAIAEAVPPIGCDKTFTRCANKSSTDKALPTGQEKEVYRQKYQKECTQTAKPEQEKVP